MFDVCCLCRRRPAVKRDPAGRPVCNTCQDAPLEYQTKRACGRNEPCPCKSGRKYKVCCGK